MPKPVFRDERCKGCGLCVAACPKKILALAPHFNNKGYPPATCTDESKCIGCAICLRVCPDMVINIQK